jgi:hypothetical protein
VFVVAAALASLALMAVMGRLSRDFEAVEAALRARESSRPSGALLRGPFGRALRRFFDTLREAEGELARLRSELDRGRPVRALTPTRERSATPAAPARKHGETERTP